MQCYPRRYRVQYRCGQLHESWCTPDVDTAYSLFIEGVARKDIEKLVLENSHYFKDYEDVSMKGINIEYFGPDFAEYKGTAKYSDGKRIGIVAALVKVEDDWKLVSVWFA